VQLLSFLFIYYAPFFSVTPSAVGETFTFSTRKTGTINALNAELNPMYHLLALLGPHHILHVSRIRVNQYRDVLTEKLGLTHLMEYEMLLLENTPVSLAPID